MEMGTDAAANLRPRLMRDINCLHDPDRLTRKGALASLRMALLPQDNGKQPPPPKEEALRKFLVDTLLGPLVALFADPMEFCREQSMLLLLDTVARTTDNASDTSTVCRAVAVSARNRIGCNPFEEPSEEVRLLLLRVLQSLWDRPSASVWGHCAIEDTADVVTYSLSDIFPEVKRQSCVLLQRLIAVCKDGVRVKFQRLVRALSGNLTHQHSKTRQLALTTLAPLILCGGSDLEKVFRDVVMQNLEVLLNDKAPGVRRELVTTLERITVAMETGEARELVPHQSRLASLLLSCLLDTVPDIAEWAEKSIGVVGNAWLSASKRKNSAYGSDFALTSAENGSEKTVASKAYICTLVPELVPLTVEGMTHWTVPGRRRFCGLLGEIIARAGGNAIAPYLDIIVLALCTSSTDGEEDVRQVVQQASKNLGIVIEEPSSVIDILIPIISGHVSGKASPQYCIEALLVLRPFLSCVDTSAAGHIAGQTVKALSVTHILSAARDDALTAAVLGVCEIICSSPYVELLKGDSSMEALTVMIWLLGRSSPTHLPSVHARCYEIMENLAMANERDGVQSLLYRFFLPLLKNIVNKDKGGEAKMELESCWADDPSVRHAFSTLLESAPMAVASHVSIVMPYFCVALKDVEKDSRIRLDLMVQLQSVLGSDYMTPTIVKPQLNNIVHNAIFPNLTWRMGIVAATLRKVAVACLYTMLHGEKLDTEAAYSLGPSLLPVLNTNLEDGDATVRRMCCMNMHIILRLLPGILGEDTVRLLYPELLKRLDDSSNDVRLAACDAINSLFMATPKVHLQGTPLEYSVEQLLIHLDDQSPSIQEAVMKPLRTAVHFDACMVSRKASQARESHRSPKYVDELIQ